MKKNILMICMVAIISLFAACGGSKHDDKKFAGSFEDMFGNQFTLNEDYTGTIQFAGMDKVEKITWYDGDNHDSPFATISWNGDPAYYYLRDGVLYRHKKDMDSGRAAIKIEYKD